jgi:hypothetical protein
MKMPNKSLTYSVLWTFVAIAFCIILLEGIAGNAIMA